MAATILFHGSGVGPTDFADGAAFAHLQAGYGAANVTYMQGDLAAADGSSANGFDLLVISSTVPSGTVRGKYEDTTVGVVNWEAAVLSATTFCSFQREFSPFSLAAVRNSRSFRSNFLREAQK